MIGSLGYYCSKLLSAAAPFPVNAVEFDGTNDYMINTTATIADSASGIFSGWYNFNAGGDESVQPLCYAGDGTNRIEIDRWTGAADSEKFRVVLASSGANLVIAGSDTKFNSTDGWAHFLIAWELDVTPVFQMYVNDVEDLASGATIIEGLVDHSVCDYAIGTRSITTAANLFNGCQSEVYFNTDEYIDISIESNRRKFISAAGKPVDLGSDGSTPTGAAPSFYLNGDSTNFQTNQGDEGNFTVTGALTNCASAPSD